MPPRRARYLVGIDFGTACIGYSVRRLGAYDISLYSPAEGSLNTVQVKASSDLTFVYDPATCNTPRDRVSDPARCFFSSSRPANVSLAEYPRSVSFRGYKMALYPRGEPLLTADEKLPVVLGSDGELYPLYAILLTMFKKIRDHLLRVRVPKYDPIRSAEGGTEKATQPPGQASLLSLTSHVVVTVPAIASELAMRFMVAVVTRAFRVNGLSVSIVHEPDAALMSVIQDDQRRAQYAGQAKGQAPGGIHEGEYVAILDIGGGTSDFIMTRVTDVRSMQTAPRIEVIVYSEGFPVGGWDVDRAFLHFMTEELLGSATPGLNDRDSVVSYLSSAFLAMKHSSERDKRVLLPLEELAANCLESEDVQELLELLSDRLGKLNDEYSARYQTLGLPPSEGPLICLFDADDNPVDASTISESLEDIDADSLSLGLSHEFVVAFFYQPVIDMILEATDIFLQKIVSKYPDVRLQLVGGFTSCNLLTDAITKRYAVGKPGPKGPLKKFRVFTTAYASLAIAKGASFTVRPASQEPNVTVSFDPSNIENDVSITQLPKNHHQPHQRPQAVPPQSAAPQACAVKSARQLRPGPIPPQTNAPPRGDARGLSGLTDDSSESEMLIIESSTGEDAQPTDFHAPPAVETANQGLSSGSSFSDSDTEVDAEENLAIPVLATRAKHSYAFEVPRSYVTLYRNKANLPEFGELLSFYDDSRHARITYNTVYPIFPGLKSYRNGETSVLFSEFTPFDEDQTEIEVVVHTYDPAGGDPTLATTKPYGKFVIPISREDRALPLRQRAFNFRFVYNETLALIYTTPRRPRLPGETTYQYDARMRPRTLILTTQNVVTQRSKALAQLAQSAGNRSVLSAMLDPSPQHTYILLDRSGSMSYTEGTVRTYPQTVAASPGSHDISLFASVTEWVADYLNVRREVSQSVASERLTLITFTTHKEDMADRFLQQGLREEELAARLAQLAQVPETPDIQVIQANQPLPTGDDILRLGMDVDPQCLNEDFDTTLETLVSLSQTAVQRDLRHSVYFISDGHSYLQSMVYRQIVAQAFDNMVFIGFGQCNEAGLRQMANYCNGIYVPARDATALRKLFGFGANDIQ